MSSDPVDTLQEATQDFNRRWRAGASPRVAFEEFYDTALVAASRLRGPAALTAAAEQAVVTAVEALLGCGQAVFDADPEAARTLGELLAAARHLAGLLAPDSARDARFDDLSRQWHRRTMG